MKKLKQNFKKPLFDQNGIEIGFFILKKKKSFIEIELQSYPKGSLHLAPEVDPMEAGDFNLLYQKDFLRNHFKKVGTAHLKSLDGKNILKIVDQEKKETFIGFF